MALRIWIEVIFCLPPIDGNMSAYLQYERAKRLLEWKYPQHTEMLRKALAWKYRI